MKKIFAMIVMAVAVAMPSHAQVSFGLKGGLNLTSMSINNSNIEDLFKNKAGFFIGPTVKFTLPVVGLSLDAAALYDQRQANVEAVTDLSGNTSTEKIKQQTIQIPVNVRYGVGLGDLASLFFFAGPQFGFNVGSKTKDLFGVGEWSMKSSNVSANIGIGATLSKLQITANYNIALGKTGEVDLKSGAESAWNTVVGKAKANSWQIALAYYF